jgi:hypothetical protein
MSSDAIWRDIRRLRADPPGLAGEHKARRKVFGAALQQAEELHEAAAHSGFSSRPLPLFYALSQGGRAIAAARAHGSHWELSGHGLKAKFHSEEVMAARISPDSSGAFQVISEATGSPVVGHDLSLGALAATLPELCNAAVLAPHPTALRLDLEYDATLGEYSVLVPPYGSVAIYAGPEANLPADSRREQAMADLLKPYERAKGWAIQPGIRYSGGFPCIALTWPLEDADGQRGYKALEVVATRVGDCFYLRPTLGESGGEISILMTWWAVLLALSSLARYEPARWQRALDIDQSSVAATLEEILNVAQERVPSLLYEALTDETF